MVDNPTRVKSGQMILMEIIIFDACQKESDIISNNIVKQNRNIFLKPLREIYTKFKRICVRNEPLYVQNIIYRF